MNRILFNLLCVWTFQKESHRQVIPTRCIHFPEPGFSWLCTNSQNSTVRMPMGHPGMSLQQMRNTSPLMLHEIIKTRKGWSCSFFMVLDTYDFFTDATKLAHPPTPTVRDKTFPSQSTPPTPPPHTHILTPSIPPILNKIKLLLVCHNCSIRYIPEANTMQIPPLEFSSAQFKMVSMRLERPICAPAHLPEMSPMLPLKHLQKPKAVQNNTNGRTQTLIDDTGFRLHHNFNLLMSSLRKSVLKSKQSNSLNK